MNDGLLPLIGTATLVTLGEQVYLARRHWALAAMIGLAYGLSVLLLSGSWAAVGTFVALYGLIRLAAEHVYLRRGPDLWTGLGVLAPPYLALWLAWAWAPTEVPQPVAQALTFTWRHLAFSAGPGRSLPAHLLTLLAAYAFCWGSATFVTRAVLSGFSTQRVLQTRGNAPLLEVAAADEQGGRGLDRAGRLIGDLERTLVLSLVLTGNFTAIGFVVAAKSVARWEFLRTHAEYFLVGTFCSMGLALIIGMAAARLLAVGSP